MKFKQDRLIKFLFDTSGVKGELVELIDAWIVMQSHQRYPKAISKLLGEMTAAALLLNANIKFDGSLILQVRGDGPVRLLVVECSRDMTIRATAKFDQNADIDEDTHFSYLINQTGRGLFAITLDPDKKVKGQQPYQGIVSLTGNSIAEVIENYMQQSEQLDTKIILAANDNVCRGLLLQKMPSATDLASGLSVKSEQEEKAWQELVILTQTLKKDEMLSTDIETLKHRLFWENPSRHLTTLYPQFACRCNKEKVSNMLKMLGQKEVEEALDETDEITVNCDFCCQGYTFSRQECMALFDEEKPQTVH